jgi:hypothetical protein
MMRRWLQVVALSLVVALVLIAAGALPTVPEVRAWIVRAK